MNITRDRVRSIGWMFVLCICFATTMAVSLRVNALKSQVRLTERQIVALQRDKLLLETEFATRANQQQLRALNDVEFGFTAPTAGQYIEGERQLAELGKPRSPDAPAPIRVASVASEEVTAFPAMVSPLTGKAMAVETPAGPARKQSAGLEDRLSRVEPQGVAHE